MRFDFSWNGPVSPDKLLAIEQKVNAMIENELPVYNLTVGLDDAQKIYSLRSVFGEQYPDPVRVVAVGNAIEDMKADPTNTAWASGSIEFCGGTHLTNTKEAGASPCPPLSVAALPRGIWAPKF